MAYVPRKPSQQRITVSKKKTGSSYGSKKDISDWLDDNWFSEDSDFLILVKKTGYYNFTVNGKHYYCDERIDKSKLTNSLLVYAFNGGQSAQKKKKKKGKITITKK